MSLPTDFPTPPAWTIDAVCAQVDMEMFFPVKGESARQAKSICRSCPVRTECLDYALERDDYGVWGGLTNLERAAVRRRIAA